MSKSKIQGAFDFFSAEPESVVQPEEPIKKSVLLPPKQIEADAPVIPLENKEEDPLFPEHDAMELARIDEQNEPFTKLLHNEAVKSGFEASSLPDSSSFIIPQSDDYDSTSEVQHVVAAQFEEIEMIMPEDKVSTKKIIEKVQKQDFTVPQHKRPSGTRGRKSVKENSIIADLVEIPADDILFQKQYYSMGDVTQMFKENHSLIRYWASEFTVLKPKKNKKGDRFFRPEDVKNLQLIHDLLRRKKYTIEGAKEYLKNMKKAEEKFATIQSLQNIKTFFLELKANI